MEGSSYRGIANTGERDGGHFVGNRNHKEGHFTGERGDTGGGRRRETTTTGFLEFHVGTQPQGV